MFVSLTSICINPFSCLGKSYSYLYILFHETKINIWNRPVRVVGEVIQNTWPARFVITTVTANLGVRMMVVAMDMLWHIPVQISMDLVGPILLLVYMGMEREE